MIRLRRLLSVKIKTQLSMLIAVYIALTSLTLFIAHRTSYDVLYGSMTNSVQQSMNRIDDAVGDSFDQLIRISNSCQYNANVQRYFWTDDGYDLYSISEWFSSMALGYQLIRDDIYDICFISDNRRYANNDSSYMLNQLTVQISDGFTRGYKIGVIRNIGFRGNQRMYYYLISPVYSQRTLDFGEVVGYTVIFSETGLVSDILKSLQYSEHSELHILDSAGVVMGAVNESELMSERKDDIAIEDTLSKPIISGGSIYYCSTIKDINWKIVCRVPQSDALGALFAFQRVSLTIAAVCILLLLLLSLTIRRSITAPINAIIGQLRSVGKGDLNLRLSLHWKNELDTICQSINKALDDIQTLTTSLVERQGKVLHLEVEKKQAELLFLQSQINPHFLYNTLESIRSIAVYYGAYEVERISVALANMFRYSVKEAAFVPLSKELALVNGYMDIQNIRFRDKFSLQADVDPELLDYPLPKLTLQPLVENAVLHGISKRTGAGAIELCVKRQADTLCITVRDDGVGIEAEKLAGIRRALDISGIGQGEDAPGMAIGLKNVYAKLKLLYARVLFGIDSVAGEYTCVRITIPCQGGQDVQSIDG